MCMFKPHKTPRATSFSCKHLVPLQWKFFCTHSGVCRNLESRSLMHIKGEQTCYMCITLFWVLNGVVRKINSSVLNLKNAFVLDRHLKGPGNRQNFSLGALHLKYVGACKIMRHTKKHWIAAAGTLLRHLFNKCMAYVNARAVKATMQKQ